MKNDILSRRRFMECAVMTVALLPIHRGDAARMSKPATASASPAIALANARAASSPPTLTLFDPRFDRARDMAVELAAGGATRPIEGDATDIALWLSSARHSGKDILVRGVTLESIPFCLKHGDPRALCVTHRLDRDLFVWSMHITPPVPVFAHG